MMRRIARILIAIIALSILGAASLAYAMYKDWPWWAAVLVCLAIVVIILLALSGWRRWTTWRLKKRLASTMSTASPKASYAEFDQQWQAGLAVLRQSRYVGQTVSARRLPWILALDINDIPSQAFAGLAVKSLPGQTDAQAGPPTIGWYFLRRSVMLHAGKELFLHHADDPTSSWHRLLYSLNRLRRQEPLNGVALRMDTATLLQTDEISLAALGRSIRVRLDELARTMDARMPVWLILTGSQHLPGLSEWAMSMEETRRHAVFGATLEPAQVDQPISDRIRTLFSSIETRLFDLRIAQGMHGALPPEMFEFSLQVQTLQDPIQRLLAPAFDASPYAPAPLLQGLYLTAQGNAEQQWVPLFSQTLYDDTLPAQRAAWIPLEHWRQSRRLIRRTAVTAWLIVCGITAAGMVYAWRQVQNEINELEKRPLQELNFEGELEKDLQSLHIWRDATVKLLSTDSGWNAYLPMMGHLNQLHSRYREQFSKIYRNEILFHAIDPLLSSALPEAAQRGDDVELAAWAQYLVRRINLIQARLDGRPLKGLPLPGKELREIFLAAGLPAPGAQAAVLSGQLYRDYLAWQSEDALLRSEQDSLRAALLQLGLDVRSPTWLLAWADLQDELQPITLGDFWNIPADPSAPHIPAGLTPNGSQAIERFVSELGLATEEGDLWKSRDAELARRFRQASADAWYRFADYVPDARRQLPNETAWRNHVSNAMTHQDPHLAVMHQIAQLFSDLPADERPVWTTHIIELDRLLKAAQTAGPNQGSLLNRAKVAGTLGGDQLRNLANGASLSQSADELSRGLDSTSHIREYQRQILGASQQALQGPAGAMKLATDTWGYGHDPAIQDSTLHKAEAALQELQERLGSDDTKDNVVWDLIRGPLQLTQDYVSRSAACQLQSRWDANVRGAIQGVENSSIIDDLLYGERGQVPLFLSTDVPQFIDKTATRYEPRQALNMTIPLNSQFYAFASNAQQHQIRRMQSVRTQSLDQKVQQAQEQSLQEEIGALEKQQAKIRTQEARVRITGEAPLVSPGAKILPQQIRLTMQCSSGSTRLENYNFPVSKTFTWSAQDCAETTLEIRFQGLVLQKTYPGPYGFTDFLAAFPDGKHTFAPEDFPEQATLMRAQGLDSLTIRWKIQDAAAAQSLSYEVQKTDADLAERQAALREARDLDLRRTITQASGPANAAVIPVRITDPCWRPEATATIYDLTTPATSSDKLKNVNAKGTSANKVPAKQTSSESRGWFVQVGVFGSTKKAEGTLEKEGFSHHNAPLKSTPDNKSYILYAGPFSTREQASSAGQRIDQLLALKSIVVKR
jgi:type VI secretion system protein ImpL